MNPVKWLLYTLLLFNLFKFSTSIDTITSNRSIRDGELILSGGKVFALGFFSPGNSAKRYLGIWYNQISEKTIVWVANRNHPISGTSGILSINGQGNLVLYHGNQSTLPVWFTNVSVTLNDTVAQLLDSGNLVLAQNGSENMLWQSFDYPTDTMLPFMKLGLDRKTGLNRFLSSWKSPDDPGIGNYSYRIDPTGFPQLSLYKGSDKWWRTGSWTGQRWSGVPEMTRNYIFNVSFVNNEDAVSIMYAVTDPSVLTRMEVNESGMQQRFNWNRRDNRWIGFWSAPKEQCDYYNHCGPNSNCNPYRSDVFECTCLPGYEPKYPQEWYLRDGSSGCKRKLGMSTCQNREGFIKVPRVKVPDTSVTHVDMSLDLNECEIKCLSNCSCVAYTSAYPESKSEIGCLTYHGDLIDTRTYTNVGPDLYVRVNAAELALYAKNGSLGKKEIVAIVVSSSVAILLLVALVYWFYRRKIKVKSRSGDFTYNTFTSSTFLDVSLSGKDQDGDRRNTDLPLFDFSTIAAATNNFSIENKLGEGGFGSVYKGVLPNGQEIAIKRLSKYSGQGIGEFKNEVSLIAKLQHRNLVSIVGCCIEAEEKMLVYEYVPNKSLDFFIFNETKRKLLDWNKRFEIICGIARGILYLHQDSRLRIIHRDLKASNVLLDSALNPKISDFGMARIFGGEQIEGNTNRVVGTYGYMSPEYAMEGLFSIKSDVYSFGVLLVEIITGIKNSGFHLEDCDSSNLVGHVWDLWREGKAMEIVDKSMWEESSHSAVHEVLRCVHIGLLCVQEQATDRPTMSSVVFMLGNDNPLPSPKQPAFIGKIRSNKNGDATWTGTTEGGSSINDLTISTFHGR